IRVLDGLEAGEEIVISAQFLLDSESRLQEAIQKMLASRNGRTAEPVDHSMMDHGAMAPTPEAEPVDHSTMDHSTMDHGAMSAPAADSTVDHSMMDHGAMPAPAADSTVDHSMMDHKHRP
ncbi:MAG: hypothetical protein HKN29_11000, partial [Rhodothermales bacterium]|nr:hypothetical protein [Rhodothermales bacterium]